MPKEQVSAESAKSALRANISRALAQALITGIDNCEQEGYPLMQLQQIHLATMHIMAYEQAIEAADSIDVEVKLLTSYRHPSDQHEH